MRAKSTSIPKDVESMMEEAIRLEEQGDRYAYGEKARRFYERAAEWYLKAEEKSRDDVDCLYNGGRLLMVLGTFEKPKFSLQERIQYLDKALTRFRRVQQVMPEYQDNLFNLAQCLCSMADVAHDKEVFETECGPSSEQQQVAAYQEAQAILSQLVALNASDAHASLTRVETYKEAVLAWVDAVVSQAVCFYHQMLLNDAHGLFQQALEALDTLSNLYTSESISHCSLVEQKQLNQHVIEIKSKRATVLWTRAQEKSGIFTQNLLEEKPSECLQEISLLLQDAQQALAIVEQLIDPSRPSPSFLSDKGDILVTMGHILYIQCQCYAIVQQPIPDDIVSCCQEAYAKASRAFTTALRIEPDNIDFMVQLGDIYLSSILVNQQDPLEMAKQAVMYYEKALSKETYRPRKFTIALRLAKSHSYIPENHPSCLKMCTLLRNSLVPLGFKGRLTLVQDDIATPFSSSAQSDAQLSPLLDIY